MARRQGVHLMLATALTPDTRRQPWVAELLREVRTSATFHERRDAMLRGLLDALCAGNVDTLLIKGAALSHTHYPEPYMRHRVDIDLLVRRSDVDRAQRVLECHGWSRDVESDAELATGQRHYTKLLGAGGRVERVDLHWRVANPLVFARALSFDELHARAVPIPSLGAAARTLAPADALLLACLHRVAHHAGDTAAPALLWLTDICLIVERLDRLERDRFLALAARESLRAVCRDGLGAAAARLDSSACAHLAASLPPSPR
ncbi:MAG: nucleotidyltransferase family protein, partial [Vicinamibacterales bacterium]